MATLAYYVSQTTGVLYSVNLSTTISTTGPTLGGVGTYKPQMKPDNTEIWCVSTKAGGFIYVVNVSSLTVTHTINVGGTQTFCGAGAFSQDGSLFITWDFTNSKYYSFNTSTYANVTSITGTSTNTGNFGFWNPNSGGSSFASAGGTQLQIANFPGATTSSNLTTNGGANNNGGCWGIGSSSSYMYIISRNAGNVVVVNASTSAPTINKTLATTPTTYSAIPSPTGDRIYIGESNLLAYIDTSTNTFNASTLVVAAGQPYGSCITADGTTLVIVNQSIATMYLINIPAFTINTSFSISTSQAYGVCTALAPSTTAEQVVMIV